MASRRKSARRRYRRSLHKVRMPTSSGQVQNLADGACQDPPCRGVRLELFAPGPCQFVELGVAVVVRRSPLRFDPATTLEPVQGGIERSLLDLDHAGRDLLQPLG